MLIFRYLISEVFKSQLAVFLVLTTIFVSQKFVRVLADASEGDIPGQLVLTIMLLNLPQLAGLILPLSVFLGVLLAYGRIYSENEMTILHACGISEWYVARITVLFSLLATLVCASFTLYLSPWAYEYEYQVIEQAEASSGLSTLIAGRFQETGNQKAVVFVQDLNRESTTLEKVFVAQAPKSHLIDDKSKVSIVYAESGHVVEEASGVQRLILSNGHRYQGNVQQKNAELVDFEAYQLQIRDQEVERKRRKIRAYPTEQLWNDTESDAIAEWQWRLAIPLSIPILVLIAVPLSSVNPRQGKFAKMIPALGLYIFYYVILIAGRSALEDGKIPASLGLWWIHLSTLFIGAFLILKGRPIGGKLRATLTGRNV